MIVIKVTNASDVVASKIGRFLADLTPSGFDQQKVEEELIKQLVEQLGARGFQGEVASVQGMDLHNQTITVDNIVQVRGHRLI
jgi:hypothetical protein